jgi:prophage antirepressor-like protein
MFMQNLSIFNYNQSSVRTFLDKNNELWFLINDVCAILDYKNPHRALNLHCKPKGITKRYTPKDLFVLSHRQDGLPLEPRFFKTKEEFKNREEFIQWEFYWFKSRTS